MLKFDLVVSLYPLLCHYYCNWCYCLHIVAIDSHFEVGSLSSVTVAR